ncbi:TetR/AcrR family transcriptional regulator [Enemella evansiae]|uniref:TetR/AcrR family transcriptional regulator n=1 Tax=Enemella evansiae TaxID=2016499 RepID=UPI0010E7007C|nr:TetR/AcrR family transcriptional regulator [Enemella evansiae]TDO89794.1 TetR family transcriptional regulator [Enemella evansiae]
MAEAGTQNGGRRAQILAAAREIVAEEGLSGITVRAVAARAGIGASTLRHYFPSQAALHTAVTRELFAVTVTDDFIGDTALPPRERLLRSLGQYLPPDQGSPQEFARMLVRTYAGVIAAEEAGGDVPTGGILGNAYAWSHETIMRWLRVLADEGALRAEPSPAIAIALMGLLNGLLLDLAVGGIEPEGVDQGMAAMIALLVEE